METYEKERADYEGELAASKEKDQSTAWEFTDSPGESSPSSAPLNSPLSAQKKRKLTLEEAEDLKRRRGEGTSKFVPHEFNQVEWTKSLERVFITSLLHRSSADGEW